MRFYILFFLISPITGWSESFRLPSYAAFSGGLGDNGYKDGALNLGLSLPRNWQFEAGADKTVINSSDESGSLVSRGAHLGLGTDPLRDFSLRVVGENWQVSDDVKAAGARASITYAPGAWSFTLEAIGQRMKFTGLPPLVSTSGEQTVNDTGFSFRISTLTVRQWNFFVAATGHAYDKDLAQLSDLPAITLNNMPASVLTTLTGLSRNDASLGATYMFRRFDVGFEGGRSISAIDGVRTRRFGLNAMFYLNRAWSFGLNTMAYIPEASQESSASSNSTVGVVTFKW